MKLLVGLLCVYLASCSPISHFGKCSQTPLAVSSNDFGFQLFKNVDTKDKNVFVSPYSIYAALAMVHRGAGNNTARQLEQAFHLNQHGLQGTRLQESFQQLLWSFARSQDKYTLLTANALFAQKNFTINPKYLEDLHSYFMAALKLVDFNRNSTGAMNDINQWVSENTKSMIKKLVDQPLSRDTVLTILNAVYFKGTWKNQFNKNLTIVQNFYRNSYYQSTSVKFMHQTGKHYRFLQDPVTNYKFLELPYKGEDIAMLLALPTNLTQPADLEMSSALLCRVNSSLRNISMDRVVIPKFKLEYAKELSTVLKQLGINDLFSRASNLTGISRSGNLQVSKVLHKAVVDVNEEGSEAAAVTAVIIKTTSVLIGPKNEFVANHPFLFYIVDKRSGLVLFSGRVVDP